MTNDPAGPVKIGLVQINNSFSGQNYLPYSIALLQTYVQKFAPDPSRYEFLTPLYKRVRIADAVEALKDADLVGFSTYVWNGRISLEIARRLKALKPGIVIVFGGPHVPDQPEAFLRANPQIDLAVHNEGERTFLKLLEAWPDRDAWAALAGVSMVKADGSFVRNPNIDRVRDLDEIPSPFLEGAFDAIMAANPNESWIGLWETNRGCPFRCTFCDWGSATAGKVTKFGEERLFREVDWFAEKKIEYIFCCDANFGIQKRDVDIANYVADIKKTTGYPVALSVQNTKNATERAYLTQKILSDAGLNKGVALSMQSVDMTDARGDQARQHLARHLHGAAAPLHQGQGRDLLGPDPRPARRDLRIVRQGRRPADGERPAQPHPVQQPVDPAQRRDGRLPPTRRSTAWSRSSRRSSTSTASGSSSTTTCRKSRTSSSPPRPRRWPTGAAPASSAG